MASPAEASMDTATPVVAAGTVPNSPSARLMITHMRMENFKSYLGVQEVGPFHQCFSSVVGPNGSGKSNVIDALLFVFGYRAKKIRQAKLKDLIHKSEGHTNLDSCRVSVFFSEVIDKPDGSYETVPNSEFVVMREATSANQSNYYLNGKKMTFKEIGTLLRAKGIDLDHNRFLILQGEVESIAMMKPKAQHENDDGLLEYLEDIIGSNQFKEDIVKDETQLAELNEQRSEKLARVKVVETEKNKLEGGKNEAEAYLGEENELTMLQSKLYQLFQFQSTKQLEDAQTKLNEVNESASEQRAQLAALQKDVKIKEQELKVEQKQVNQLQTACEQAKADFIAFERKDIKHKEEHKFLKNKIKKLTASIAKDQKQLNQEASRDVALEEDRGRWQEELQASQQQLDSEEKSLEEMLEGLQGEMQAQQDELATRQAALAPFSQARAEAKANLEVKQGELELLTRSSRELAQTLESAQQSQQQAEADEETKTQALAEVQQEEAKVLKQLGKAKKELANVEAQLAPLEQSCNAKRVTLEEARAASSSSRAQSAVLVALKRFAAKNNLSGFHGRLGDLGTIDDAYDVAVTTACGALNNMVVDTAREAKLCVEFLRKHNVGRASFIIMEKITAMADRAAAAFTAPSGTQRLFDLVQPRDQHFVAAFYWALRDTLVAKDLNQATTVAYKGSRAMHRVVTLKGEVIDTSGTMSGGGKKVMRGGMSSSLTPQLSERELEEMETDMSTLTRELNDLRQRQQQLSQLVESLQEQAADCTARAKRLQMEIANLGQKKGALETQIADLTKRSKAASKDVAQCAALEKEIAQLEAAFEEAKQRAAEYEQAVRDGEEALANVGGVVLKAKRSKVDDLRQAIVDLKQQITRGAVDGKACSRKTTQLSKRVEASQKELAENEEALVKLQESFKEIEEGAIEVIEQREEAERMLQEHMEVLTELKRAHDDALDAMSQLKSTMVDIEHQVEELTKTVKDSAAKNKHWQKKLSGLSLHRIGYEDMDELDEESEQVKSAAPTQLETLDEAALLALDKDALEYDITILSERLQGRKPNMSAIEQFYKKEKDYLARVGELDEVTELRDGVRKHYEDLRKQRLDMFMGGFSIITNKLKEMYQMITLGGDAELELVDRLNPFSEGIVFSVRPPKKSWKNISNLSGGEKTLSSLALVFALHHFKPTPLYVMDEIDAALDFKNVSIVANYIKERTKNAQFIIISLRNNMFELADRLIGIYKTDNATKSVTIDPALVAAQARAREQAIAQQASAKSAALAGPVADASLLVA